VVDRLTDIAGFDRSIALTMAAAALGLSEQTAARMVKKGRISIKRQMTTAP
jgi:hypothetical protein